MIISLLAFYSGMLPEGTDPKVIMWMAAAGSLLSLVLKQFFPSGVWVGSGMKALFWVINIGVFVSAVLTSWNGIGVIGASVTTMIVGTINVLLSYLGYVPNKTIKQ